MANGERRTTKTKYIVLFSAFCSRVAINLCRTSQWRRRRKRLVHRHRNPLSQGEASRKRRYCYGFKV
uniref:Uncharacterized protein n=1 Tax=Cannabis sativa TaxID=3483 RepID=A0A803RAI1_CANSA